MHGTDDPFIPLDGEAREVAKGLGIFGTADYHEVKKGSHFFTPTHVKSILDILEKKAKEVRAQKKVDENQDAVPAAAAAAAAASGGDDDDDVDADTDE